MSDSMLDQSVEQFVRALAARTPSPGGGSAAGVTAAMGVGLVLMALRYSVPKEGDAQLDEAVEFLNGHLDRLLPLADRDAAAFESVLQAYKLAKDTPEMVTIRKRAIQDALVGAVAIPVETLCLCRDVTEVSAKVVGKIKKSIISDMAAGAEFLSAAADSAFLNVRINTTHLEAKEDAAMARERGMAVRQEILTHLEAIRGAVDTSL